MIASAVSKTIFYMKATEYKTNIYTHMLSGSVKNIGYFGSLAARASPKISGGTFADYSSTRRSGGFKFVSSKGGSEFETLPENNTEHVSGE